MCNLTKAPYDTSPFIKIYKRSLNYTLYILKSMKNTVYNLVVNIFTDITIYSTLSQVSL